MSNGYDAMKPTQGPHGAGSTILTRPDDAPPLWGQETEQLFPDFAIIAPLASGAMSRVYHVMDRVTEEHFALKEAPMALGYASSLRERMEREWNVMRTLRHKHVVRGFELRLTERCFYLVMELVQGTSLQQLVTASGPLNPEVAANYTRQAAEGLLAAHNMGIVHRDVKPSNLLCDSDGLVKVIDFGMAWIDRPDEPSITLLHNDTLLGTVDYMAPEQATSCHYVDARADIYALGCTLYFMLTGHAPFATGSIATRLLRHRTERAESIGQLRPEVPQSLVDLCEKMMEKSPDDRFASMDEVVVALESWLKEQNPSKDDEPISLEMADEPNNEPEQELTPVERQKREVQQLLACLDSSLREGTPDRPVSMGVAVLLSTLRDHIEALLAGSSGPVGAKIPEAPQIP